MRSHSWLSPNCVAGPSSVGGHGVFAAAPIAAGELVCVMGGVVITAAELDARRRQQPGYDDPCFAVHTGFWLAPVGSPGTDDVERLNHSCGPNLGIRGQVVVVARRPIRVGEELTLDYETFETDLPAFACRCGAAGCRGVIDGRASRDPAFRARHAGYLSWSIENSATH